MQRVGFQRLARRLLGDPIEQACAEEIHHDRDDDDGESPDRRLDGMTFGKQQPLERLPDDKARQHEQQAGFDQCRDAFDLAVAVMVLCVGGLAGDAHRVPGHHGRDEIERRMRGLGKQRERAREHEIGRASCRERV